MEIDTEQHAEERSWLYQPSFPEGWTHAPLYSLANWVNGLAFRDLQFSKSGMPVIKIAEIKGGITGQTKFTTQTFDEKVRVRSGDMLFSWSGQPETSIDVFRWDGPEGWLNQHVFRVTAKDEVLPEFLFYLLRYLKPSFIGIAKNKQTTGLGHVTKRDLERMIAAYPSKNEQREIAATLGAIDGRIDSLRRINATLEEMARVLFQSWFVDFDPVHAKVAGQKLVGLDDATSVLFPSNFDNKSDAVVPTGWRATTLKDVIEIFDSKRIPLSGREREARKGTYPYHGAASVMDHVDDYLFDGIYVLMGEDGSVINVDGTAVLQYVWGKFWVNNHAHVLRGKNSISTEHLLLHLKSCNIAAFVNGAVQLKLNQGNLNRIPFMLPSPEIGEAFAKSIEPLFAKIRANTDQSRTLATLRDTLLPKLFNGELSVMQFAEEAEPA
ncbi:MAG: restriction endonuclease subunit S [Opitutus sp.]|nr:restriction endonuclease subunit S [Opitutus sp.]MCS6246044.1 restriction endonuclease subunit S [Opitutus sp.]MCS6273927.1 restriction endonuclease subunit S [Opitutus sp.]MCS6276229.1 restriction endonuclease subunit S [Opitutus sp.]MCS6301323.1 restriction endonuclease subunit S [Opitutus sp.]